ncbi:ATP-dependent Clp protease ATP-binding subunit [Dyadobacter frigoris]|uniref:ATP-dependent Clp protease ATP-binding subunit n=1 Tax=Dyadobacter frigoris TaxID=2576211 RepID=A0A4U6CYH8_9BACT|nr:ATP-dependent Clp protease ATP-binding subunit [Dyadobacter frigoris]TKT88925.1 ATP-dependent Clp protease ATP-binding subunit [Dyadobacter frigoris]GLU56976.1 ATPase AAA [Dyadobacter frigoris]
MQTEALKYALTIAQSLAREYRQERFGAAHLLMAVLHNDAGLASELVMAQKDVAYLRDWAEVRLEESAKSVKVPESPQPDNLAASCLELAELIALQLNRDTDPLCVLAALLKPGVGFSADQLKSLPLTQKEVLAISQQTHNGQIHDNPGEQSASANTQNNVVKSASNFLEKYTTDKTKRAAEGKLDSVIGRDMEIRQMAEILGRRSKPNVILIGEPGVGKSALVEGFAQLITQKKVPLLLQNARLLELDTGALVAGASYKGEIEERIKGILNELKSLDKAVLFIDEIHILLDPKGSIGAGVAQLLKPELARGELTLIGATTPEEYRKYIEKDEAFSRRFEILQVEEPDEVTAIRMIQHIIPVYEAHHGLKLEEGTISEAVKLSKRYIKERRLPDVALDLLDRTMAAMRLMDEVSENELALLQMDLDILMAVDEAERVHELRWFLRQLPNRLSPLLIGQLDQQDEELDTAESIYTHLTSKLAALQQLAARHSQSVGKQEIAAVIAHKTGIPLGKLQSSERDKLLGIDEVLKKRVVGQDQAVKALSEAILESRSGLIKAGQPIGSFFLLGPTGTGKTEIAKALADFLFNDESFLIRFDMSEFKEEHSAALLYGAPPGYVGYEEGGLLVNKIRQKPYSVVLFDEIEKAHPSVFDLFLQILDEGKLHDRLGKEGDFSNAVILFTSNIGQEKIVEQFNQGTLPKSSDLMEVMAKYFRPEFLARLTEIVPFAPISEENVVKIFDIHLKGLTDLMEKQGITLQMTDEARKYIAMQGFTPRYGVRPLKGVIRNQLRRPISRMIITGEVGKGSVIFLDMEDTGEVFWKIGKNVLPQEV